MDAPQLFCQENSDKIKVILTKLQFFRLLALQQPCKTANFKVAFPKTEVLGKPRFCVFYVPETYYG
jgi:hypothetical protein